jgi:hypothetical protein
MGKSFEMDSSVEVRSSFFERRKLRRIRMIVELTLNLIGPDTTVSHREARCLVRCARKAILDLHPSFEQRYERSIRPYFERMLAERWPNEQALDDDCSGLVN